MKFSFFRSWVATKLRYIVRTEIDSALDRSAENLRLALQRRATAATAEYIERNLSVVPAFETARELLIAALQKSSLIGDRLALEFGVFQGNSINLIAEQLQSTVHGFDSFEGLPEAWRSHFDKGHFAVNGLPKVRDNVELFKGWFNDTLPIFLREHTGDVGFLHVDCDLYSSTVTVLKFLAPRLKPGAVIVFDEYFNYPGWREGEFKAFQEFITCSGLDYEYLGYNCLHQQAAVMLKSPRSLSA